MDIYVRISSSCNAVQLVSDRVGLPPYVLQAVSEGKTAVFGSALYGSSEEQLLSALSWDD